MIAHGEMGGRMELVCVSALFTFSGTCSQEENAAVVGVAMEILFQLRADLR